METLNNLPKRKAQRFEYVKIGYDHFDSGPTNPFCHVQRVHRLYFLDNELVAISVKPAVAAFTNQAENILEAWRKPQDGTLVSGDDGEFKCFYCRGLVFKYDASQEAVMKEPVEQKVTEG